MRYMKIEWLDKAPEKDELTAYIKHMFGKMGLVESKFTVTPEKLVGCEPQWLERIRGALALKWQFKVTKISGTKKKARN